MDETEAAMKRAKILERLKDAVSMDRNAIAMQADGDQDLVAFLESMVPGDWADMVNEIKAMAPAERRGELARLERAFKATKDGRLAMQILIARSLVPSESNG